MRSQAIFMGIVAISLVPLYQFFLKDVLFVTIGLWRVIQPIEDFPFTCRKIADPKLLLESCEDLWLDDEGRTLYAACVDLKSRHEWSPGGDRFNAAGRTPNGRFVALDVDSPGEDGTYGARKLQITGDYVGPAGTRTIDPNGFDVEILSDNRLRFWVANVRPPVDSVSGEFLDGKKVGTNATVDSFVLTRGENKLVWAGTFGANDAVVHSPNNVAAVGNGDFVTSNDHSAPSGLRRAFDMILGGGSLAFCDANNNCKIAASKGFNFPNGVARGLDGLFYVPSSVTGRIGVYSLLPSNDLEKVDEIKVGMPMDNLAVDANGDIFAAAFPNSFKLIKELKNPVRNKLPATVFRIRKIGRGDDAKGEGKATYEVKKMLEDREGNLLPTITTTALHDVKTGRLFLGGVGSGHMTVCEPVAPPKVEVV